MASYSSPSLSALTNVFSILSADFAWLRLGVLPPDVVGVMPRRWIFFSLFHEMTDG